MGGGAVGEGTPKASPPFLFREAERSHMVHWLCTALAQQRRGAALHWLQRGLAFSSPVSA